MLMDVGAPQHHHTANCIVAKEHHYKCCVCYSIEKKRCIWKGGGHNAWQVTCRQHANASDKPVMRKKIFNTSRKMNVSNKQQGVNERSITWNRWRSEKLLVSQTIVKYGVMEYNWAQYLWHSLKSTLRCIHSSFILFRFLFHSFKYQWGFGVTSDITHWHHPRPGYLSGSFIRIFYQDPLSISFHYILQKSGGREFNSILSFTSTIDLLSNFSVVKNSGQIVANLRIMTERL